MDVPRDLLAAYTRLTSRCHLCMAGFLTRHRRFATGQFKVQSYSPLTRRGVHRLMRPEYREGRRGGTWDLGPRTYNRPAGYLLWFRVPSRTFPLNLGGSAVTQNGARISDSGHKISERIFSPVPRVIPAGFCHCMSSFFLVRF